MYYFFFPFPFFFIDFPLHVLHNQISQYFLRIFLHNSKQLKSEREREGRKRKRDVTLDEQYTVDELRVWLCYGDKSTTCEMYFFW